MNINPRKTIAFEHPETGKAFRIEEPSVAQIEAMLKLEPENPATLENESPAKRQIRALKQCRALCMPTFPGFEHPFAIVRWAWRSYRTRRFLGSLSYSALCVVLQTLQYAAQGVDVVSLDELSRHVAETIKKKQDPSAGASSLSATDPRATSSQTT